jgi:poly-beta-1,6 N-acetyl-D-glucosamine synthase
MSIDKKNINFKDFTKSHEYNYKEEEKKKIRLIIVSGSLALVSFLLIVFTLPYTVLSWNGLFVYTTVIALTVFLLILLLRYFGILILSYINVVKYTYAEVPNFFPFVSIIVPAYNEGVTIFDSVNSLLNIDYPNFEVIIVNDGSTDDTAEQAQKLVGLHKGKYNNLIRVSLINKKNGGKSKALNTGIQYSKAEFVVCMDGDSILSPETLKLGIRHFTNPEIGAVAGNVKVINRHKLISKLQALEYIEGLNMARNAQSFLQTVNIIPGPIGIFRKKAIISAGWYDSDTYAEDADLTLKIVEAGWKVTYEPMAISYTEAPEKLYNLLKQRYRWTRGILQALRKHKHSLFSPTKNLPNFFVLWSMFYEALIWPTMNLIANIFFIVVALFFGMSNLIFYWWVTITILDVVTALFCVAVEAEEFNLVFYAIIYRLFFIMIIDVTKVMATIEEFIGLGMNWGKLERVGLLKPQTQ